MTLSAPCATARGAPDVNAKNRLAEQLLLPVVVKLLFVTRYAVLAPF